jgi:TetR/AcrR family transcriptional repressor of nem operon
MTGRPREFDDTAAIDAAMQVFWSNGYEGSSTQELCDRTGLGKGSLYNAFGSKSKLYKLALERYQKLALEAQMRILASPGTAKDRLRALLQWGVDGDLNAGERRNCMALFAAMERAHKDPAIEKIVRSNTMRLEGALCHVFTTGQRQGEISSDRPALDMTRAFLSSYYGLRILGQSMPDRAFLQDALEGTMARL